MIMLALICSLRKGGNTDRLVDYVLKGGKKFGGKSKRLYLYDHEISDCLRCCDCQKGNYLCTLNDGMQKIYPELEKADLIAFGIPYFDHGFSRRTKRFLARMRPFASNGKSRGKSSVIVICSSEDSNDCEQLIEIMQVSFGYLGMRFAGKVFAKADEKKNITRNQKVLKKAYELGYSL